MTAATMVLGLTTSVLAQEGPRQTGPDFGKASPFGLIVVVVLLICTFLLVWSMNKHLRKLPKSFDGDGDGTEPGQGTESPDAGPIGIDPDVTTENPADGTKREPG